VEKEAESMRLHEQLSQAQYVLGLQGLLTPAATLGDSDSRPLSYVSNSSDLVSGDEIYGEFSGVLLRYFLAVAPLSDD